MEVVKTKPSLKERLVHLKRTDIGLYLLVLVPIVYFIIFKYIPMFGIVIAFQDYNIFQGVFGSEFIGFEIFKELFSSADFINALRNTVLLSLGEFLLDTPAPIILALMLNEIRLKYFKKITQSILYLPHFLSWVIVGGLIIQLFSAHGFVNNILAAMGMERISFLTEKSSWIGMFLFTGVWKGAGWGTIIYLAALTNVNPEIFEAAKVDGCGRLRGIWYITLPTIFPTIAIVFVLGLGGLLDVGFEKMYALTNPYVSEISDVIATYVYRVGIQSLRYNISTAAGLFQSVVTIILVTSTNFISRKMNDEGILW
ncbi:MAG: ABC transporter permease [Candidatus Merdivicinus sp.]